MIMKAIQRSSLLVLVIGCLINIIHVHLLLGVTSTVTVTAFSFPTTCNTFTHFPTSIRNTRTISATSNVFYKQKSSFQQKINHQHGNYYSSYNNNNNNNNNKNKNKNVILFNSKNNINNNTNKNNSSNASQSFTKTILSTLSLIFIDIFFRKSFQYYKLSFPSSLAGCGFLFTLMISLYSIQSKYGDAIYQLFNPGAMLLAKWLPLFFVPSLVTLPLAQSLGSSMEVFKVACVIVGGFYFTLFTTAYSVIGARSLFQPSKKASSTSSSPTSTTTVTTTKTPTPKAFSDKTQTILSTATLLSTLVTLFLSISQNLQLPIPSSSSSTILLLRICTSCSLFFTTLSTFVFGARLPKQITSIIHPLITCTSFTWIMSLFLSKLQSISSSSSSSFKAMLQMYKVGSFTPWYHTGAGDVLLFMLGPAVLALSCQMYERKQLMKENIFPIVAGIVTSSLGGLFGTAWMVRLMNIQSVTLRKCLLSRNITSPLAMSIASMLGGDVSLAVSMVVVTGLIGANFGSRILDWGGVGKEDSNNSVARGLSIGAAAHGLGTAAFKDEKDAFPFAAIGMALTASACTVLVSIPKVKSLVLKVALGA